MHTHTRRLLPYKHTHLQSSCSYLIVFAYLPLSVAAASSHKVFGSLLVITKTSVHKTLGKKTRERTGKEDSEEEGRAANAALGSFGIKNLMCSMWKVFSQHSGI